MNVKTITCYVLLGFLMLSKLPLKAQEIGPQVFLSTPKDMTIINTFYLNIKGNSTYSGDVISSKGELKMQLVSVPIIQTFSLKGQLAKVIVLPSYGWIDGGVDFESGYSFDIPSENGLADTEVLFSVGLLNNPALNILEYAQAERKFQLNAMVGVGIPTGSYDDNKLVNMGSHRWAFRLSAPMVVPLNKNNARAANWEIVPSMFLYTDNKDYPSIGLTEDPIGIGLTNVTKSQKPMFFLEQHVSKFFTKKLWGSFDMNYQLGGETRINDVDSDDQFNQLTTGATLGFSPMDGLTLQGTYEHYWLDDDNGRMLRFGATLTIPSKKDRELLKQIAEQQP